MMMMMMMMMHVVGLYFLRDLDMIKCTQMVRPRDFCLWRPLLVDCAHERLLEPWDFLAQNIFGHRSASSGKHKNENDIQEIMKMIMIIMTNNDNDSFLAIIVTIVLVAMVAIIAVATHWK